MSGTITYSLFRRCVDPATMCAVPQDRPVPPFLEEKSWTCDKAVRRQDILPPGFEPDLAKHFSDLNGFYIFHLRTRKVQDSKGEPRVVHIASEARSADHTLSSSAR